MIDQGTEEWFAQRLGKVTASCIKDVMAKGRGGKPSATRKNYMMQLLCERLTGAREESFTSAAMQRGTDLEPVARACYEIQTGSTVKVVGFKAHERYDDIGASCDGEVGDEGLVEIKCPNTAQHVDCIQSGEPDEKYWWQMQTQMSVTGRQWCDFVSFDDRLPDALQLFVVRVERDDQAIATMLDEVLEFLGELYTLEKDMRNRMEAPL